MQEIVTVIDGAPPANTNVQSTVSMKPATQATAIVIVKSGGRGVGVLVVRVNKRHFFNFVCSGK